MIRRAALLVLVLVAGCGGGADRDPPPPAPEAVVRGWADDLRRGDVEAASARFALPAIVANGTPEMRLETRTQVRVFNDSLPCGGRVVRTRRRGDVVIATFVLTERPGGRCDGTGRRASTAFEVRDGKIVRWLRLPLGGERGTPPGEVV